jgi:hypothetical protein
MHLKAVSLDDAARERIADAAAFEKRLRLEAVVGVDQDIAGLSLRQITVKDLVNLEFTENRLTQGEEPQLDDLVALVFMLSNDRPFFKGRYARKVGKIIREHEVVRRELICYFNAAFNDMPAAPNSSSSKASDNVDSSVSVMTLVDSLASNYGWTLGEILDLSLSTALQLLQRIVNRNSEKYSMRNAITQQAKARELNRLKEDG